jgi:hypothetical protein
MNVRHYGRREEGTQERRKEGRRKNYRKVCCTDQFKNKI